MKTIFSTALLFVSVFAMTNVSVATPCADDPTYTNSVNIQGPDQFQNGLTFADFNNDGHLDALFSNDHNATVSLSLGDGAGGFSATTDFTVYDHPWGVTAADFNSDGYMDFAAVAPPSGHVVVRFGDGAGGFGPLTAYYIGGAWNDFISNGDFNGDGKADIISPSSGAASVGILLNDGTGAFSVSNVPVGGASLGVTVGDFNGDGKADFATANYNAVGSISIRLGNGTGGFTSVPDVPAGSYTWSVAEGNFNGDSIPDLAATSEGSSEVLVFAGNGTGGFSLLSSTSTPLHPRGIAAADLNNDGTDDVIAVPVDSNELRVYLGDGAGNLSPLPSLFIDYNSHIVAVADLNEDGILDFGTSNIGGFHKQVRIFMGDCDLQPVYQVEALYDQNKAHKSGSTVPVKIRILDEDGNNVSSASLAVHAAGVIQTSSQASTVLDDAGNANPDFDFRYDADLQGYVFNLKTTGYATGSYVLNFTVGGESTIYSTGFQVRK